MRREKRKREIEGETGGKREERVLTCIRGSSIVNLRILPIEKFESWSRTTPALAKSLAKGGVGFVESWGSCHSFSLFRNVA